MITLPKHDCGLHIEHNTHKSYYQTAAQWVAEVGADYDWNSNEAKQRAIDTDEVWTMTWFPNTPVGSHAVAAPTLQELLEFANSPS